MIERPPIPCDLPPEPAQPTIDELRANERLALATYIAGLRVLTIKALQCLSAGGSVAP